MSARYVQVRPDVFRELADRHELTLTERWVLVMLTMHADYEDGIWKGTQGELSKLVGVSRRNLPARLDVLEDKDLIETYWPQGHSGGVWVLRYLDLVRLSSGPKAMQHPLRKGRLGPLWQQLGRTPKAMQRRKRRDATSLMDQQTPRSQSRRVRSVEAAKGEVAAVVDINSARNPATSHSATNATPGRVADVSDRANGTGSALGAWLPFSEARAGRGSAGGGSDATPVHPRSRRADAYSPSLQPEAPLRDPRAMGAS